MKTKQYRIVTILRGIISSVILVMTEDDAEDYRKYLLRLKEDKYLEDFDMSEVTGVLSPVAVHVVLHYEGETIPDVTM